MIRLLRNHVALSTVVTTLIILVVSILLASVLTYFAINVVSTRVQEESLSVTNRHIWVDSTGTAQGALAITNTGGRDVVLSKITVRGQTSAWSNVYSNNTAVDVTSDLAFITGGIATDTDYTAASRALVLPAGSTVAIYINSPDSIAINDIGLTVGIAIHSAQAVYYSEANVQAYTPAP